MAETAVMINDTIVTVPKPSAVLIYNWDYVKSMIGLLKLGQMVNYNKITSVYLNINENSSVPSTK